MARDRLAMMGGGGGNGGYTNVADNSYPSQGQYEMEDVGGYGGSDDMSAFYAEISSIQDALKEYNANVSRISDLHSKSLNNTDDAASQRYNQQLEDLVQETSAMSNELKRRIKSLEARRGSGRDGQIRQQQTGLVKKKFVDAIQSYQDMEYQYRTKYKQRLERQFKIVKPDATPEEVRAVVDENQGGQIFSQALMTSNRYGESRAAYREVQERHEDIKKIEKTLTELAQLFTDMSILVEQQGETIDVIQGHAENTERDMSAGLKDTEAAVVSARAARKKRWICFIIILIILIIVGVVVGVVVSNNINKKN
ncbi:hypothetical protein BOTBODRAFT_29418 [Botryobasidium botryosum FD-172 SS1]|uniref:t-SNARE coiled-coil homology domain-containing protein n=1 Tax=Botryobasidium botryosum (strain FD-172 SS1) TaxID=930990 RepID=A0A067N1R1_BOTB1|nr:hypothetical protein BOTBODRAFT_29418 [Botryobasidium botryosum FD-172 SS1]